MPDSMPAASGAGHGKVILLGEHAVVYGTPALVASIDRGARAKVELSDTPSVCVNGEHVAPGNPLFEALSELAEALGSGPVALSLQVDLPLGSGLGASAAMGVAAARAIAELVGQGPSEARIAEAVDRWENVFHGNASGVDRAAAQGEGVLRFVRGGQAEPLGLRRPLPLVIAVAGPPASTREMVANVARLRDSNRPQFDKNLEAISALVQNAAVCLRSGDLRALGQLMNLCQMILSGWMLSTEMIEVACRTAREAGACGAKLTGAGGGGCMVALCESDAMSGRVEDALRHLGLDAFSTRIDAPALPSHHDHE